MEDVECVWADRPGGDGTCAKKEREEAMDACWRSDEPPNYWDWDAQECITEEENNRRQK